MPGIRLQIRKELEARFRENAMRRFGFIKGALSRASEEAIENWLKTVEEAKLQGSHVDATKGSHSNIDLSSVELEHTAQEMRNETLGAEVKSIVQPILNRYDVKRAAIFGSVARGEAGKDSDIDMLVEFKGERSLLDIVSLKMDLENKLGRKVDILTYNSLHPALKESVSAHQVPIS